MPAALPCPISTRVTMPKVVASICTTEAPVRELSFEVTANNVPPVASSTGYQDRRIIATSATNLDRGDRARRIDIDRVDAPVLAPMNRAAGIRR